MLRNTKTKRAVTDALVNSRVPISIQEILMVVKPSYPTTSFSTVYRIVRALQSAGKITQIDWRDRGSKYEWSDRAHHHHLLCDDCGRVTDIDDQLVGFAKERVHRRTGFILKTHTIELTGICPDCQGK